MRETRISIPELVLVGASRVLLGVGVGLLIADRFGRERRIAVGGTLFAIGALSTIPLAFEVLGKRRISEGDGERRPLPRQQATQPLRH